MTPDEIANLGSPEVVEKTIQILESRKQASDVTIPQGQQQESGFTPFKLEFPPELELDPKFAGVIDAMNQHYSAQMQGLVKQASSLQNEIQQQRVESHVQWLDSQIGALGKDYEPLFGSGPGYKLDQKSSTLQNRIKLDKAMATLAAGKRARGESIGSREDLLQQALNMEFAKDLQALRQRVSVQKSRNLRGQFTTPPSGPSKGNVSAEERAIQIAQEKLAALNGR
jgi:hypothetical protein